MESLKTLVVNCSSLPPGAECPGISKRSKSRYQFDLMRGTAAVEVNADRSLSANVGRKRERILRFSEAGHTPLMPEGRKVGRSEGRKVGRSESGKVGRSEGRKVGRSEGYGDRKITAIERHAR